MESPTIVPAEKIREEIEKQCKAEHQALVAAEKSAIIKASNLMLENKVSKEALFEPTQEITRDPYIWTEEAIEFARENGFEIKGGRGVGYWLVIL